MAFLPGDSPRTLRVGTTETLDATAYGPPWDSVQGTGVTSTGINLQGGQQLLVIAVDPSVIPYGTKLTINPNPFGNANLIFTAADAGGAIVGSRIDFFVASGRAAQLAWGRQTVTGTVIGSGSPTDAAILGQAGSLRPSPGGTAGLGGTGLLGNDQATFTVGDPSNPDEDYWTAINRLAQERYWYLFSDGETLYLSDGPDLMGQTPAMAIDRVNDADQFTSMRFTWDNTAWRYVSTHRKRRRTQRHSALAKVSSPVQATIDAICAIDEVRAGDVLSCSNCGPGDGGWLVGDCRRSAFQITSELSLVQALSPLSEQQVAGVGSTLDNNFQHPRTNANPLVPKTPSKASQPHTVINSLISAASTINNQFLPYELSGGLRQAGTPDAGTPGGTHQRGLGTLGYDCLGAVFAVLFDGGVFPGGAVPTSTGTFLENWASGKIPSMKYPLHRGVGTGTPECSLFENNQHIFMRLNGVVWGTADALGHGANRGDGVGTPRPLLSDGGGWIFNGDIGNLVPFGQNIKNPNYTAYHLAPSDLNRTQ